MRDYMDRQAIPPKQVTSPTSGPLPPCKQTLKMGHRCQAKKWYVVAQVSQQCRPGENLRQFYMLFKNEIAELKAIL